MNATMTKAKPCNLRDGDLVTKNGYEFVASNIQEKGISSFLNEMVYTFTGTCTENPVNDPIRGTQYNGGQYSWRNSDRY